MVVAPAFLERTWLAEAQRAGVSILFVSWSKLHKFPQEMFKTCDFWIADECHMAANPEAIRTVALYTALKANRPKYFLGLSGTPIRTRIPGLWPLLACINLNPENTSGERLAGTLMRYHGFARHFTNVKRVRIPSGRLVDKYEGVKDERLPELKALLRHKMIRFLVKDVLQDLPPLVMKEVQLDLTPPQDLLRNFEDHEANRGYDATAKSRSALSKAPLTVSYVQLLIENGSGPVVIFTDHVLSAEAIAAEFPGAALITGSTPMGERQQVVINFQAKQVPVLVATIETLGVGVTLTAGNHVVFNDQSWTPSSNTQAVARIHRITQTRVSFLHVMVASPVDAHISKVLSSKLETIEKVLT